MINSSHQTYRLKERSQEPEERAEIEKLNYGVASSEIFTAPYMQ